MALADGSIGRLLIRFSRTDVLLLDDFAMAPLKDAERRDFLARPEGTHAGCAQGTLRLGAGVAV